MLFYVLRNTVKDFLKFYFMFIFGGGTGNEDFKTADRIN